MIKGINISDRYNFTCKDDTDPKTVFVLKPLSGADLLNIQSRTAGLAQGDAIVETLDVSIVSISDVENKLEFIKGLPIDILTELFVECNNISTIKDDDKKN